MADYQGSAKAEKATQFKTVWVTITPGSPGAPPTVDSDEHHVSKKRQEQIGWQLNKPGKHFRIVFNGQTPFAKSEFGDADPFSSPALVGHGSEPYKYDVIVDDGPPLDPNVIVDP